MQNKLWEAVYSVFEEVGVNRSSQLDAEELIDLRKRLRLRIDVLRAELAERLTEREIYYVLFPIVVFLDEIVQAKKLPGERVEWIRLQKELYDIDTGGSVFYEVLEDLLRKPDTYPFIYEVFYFCLSDGYTGRYRGNLVKLNEYKDKLRKRIQLASVDPYREPKADLEPIRFESFPWHYYVISILLIVGGGIGLTKLAEFDQIVPSEVPGPAKLKSALALEAQKAKKQRAAIRKAAMKAQQRRQERKKKALEAENLRNKKVSTVRESAKKAQDTAVNDEANSQETEPKKTEKQTTAGESNKSAPEKP